MAIKLRHWRDMEGVVRDHQVYIGFGEIGHLMDAPGLCVKPIGRHEGLLFCRAGHPLLARDVISADDASWLRLGYGFVFLASRTLKPAAEAFIVHVRQVEHEVEEWNRALADEAFKGLKPGG